MSIKFIESTNQFVLETKNSQYIIEIVLGKYPCHVYYGKKDNEEHRYSRPLHSFSPYFEEDGTVFSPDEAFFELPFFGYGDFRATALRIKNNYGNSVTDFRYKNHRIFNGRKEIPRMPFAECEKSETLEITLEDKLTGCILCLYYTVFEEFDVISRYATLENRGNAKIEIEKFMSLSVDIKGQNWDMISLYGQHCRERIAQRFPVHFGSQSVFSRRGASSHQFNPFTAIISRDADENNGDAYGFNFVYSGNFLSEVEMGQDGYTRVQVGIGSENFGWILDTNETFETPEAVMTYSHDGIGQMSRNFHKFTRNCILPKDKTPHRAVVLNSWEACFFNIDENILVDFAKEAKKYGIDMLVMDDGWFGKRINDAAGLGDWFENRDRFPNGLKAFAERVKAEGINFGIWVEPEMVNPDSDLYRAHPEWILRVPGRENNLSRKQLVLDMSNREVVEYLKQSFEKTFGDVPIDYIKWDMNRHLSEVGSDFLPPERQTEVPHRYMLGVYDLLRWFRERFPNLMIETCSGGGGRYDLGMMKYGEQIWTSDNTSPDHRTIIQYGSSLAYPASTMSCHVSHPGSSEKEMDFRYSVAIEGMLGYELNILKIDENIKNMIAKQIDEYREFEPLIKDGDFYRILNPSKIPDFASYYYVNEDNSEILLSVIQNGDMKEKRKAVIKVLRADKNSVYTDKRSGEVFSGEVLQNGIEITSKSEKFSRVLYLVKK